MKRWKRRIRKQENGSKNIAERRRFNDALLRGGYKSGPRGESKEEFGRRIRKNALDMVGIIPPDTFGVYVTIHRRIHKEWILHGCIGWSLGRDEATSATVDARGRIQSRVGDVAYDAAVHDQRRKTGGDRYKIKITFMLRDLYEIDSKTGRLKTNGELFRNDDGWGCVVVSRTGGFVTYLPGVFPDEPWETFATSLASKARLPNYTDQTFYAYRVKAIEREFAHPPQEEELIEHRVPCPLLLVPHAGKSYAGECRSKAFDEVKQRVRHIYYLSADHGKANAKVNAKDDHSYTWVKEELEELFPGAVHTVKRIGSWSQAEAAAATCPEDALVVGTTDLGHYGPRYDYVPWAKSADLLEKRAFKERSEKPFIDAILGVEPDAVKRMVGDNPHLACGPHSLYALLLIARNRGMVGRRRCYVDSADVLPNDHENFVSYLSATFS